MNKNIFALAGLIALLAGLVVFSRVEFRVHDQKKSETFSKQFSLTLKDYDGADVHLFQFRRKILIAYAWATWCPYCAGELGNLGQLKQKYGDSVDILAINRGESLQVAKAFTDKLPESTRGLVFLLDADDAFFKSVGGYAMPETIFITPEGNVLYHQRGPMDLKGVQDKIEELLK